MASFELPHGDGLQFLKNVTGDGVIWLQVGVEIKLDFVAPGHSSGLDLRNVVSGNPAVTVAVFARTASKLSFSIKASAAAAAALSGMDSGGATVATLVVAAGDFKKQPGMEIDLLADVCKGADPVKTLQVQRLLNNDAENVFDQHSKENEKKIGKMMCGAVAKASGERVFGSISILTYKVVYHEPLNIPRITARSDVKYTASTIMRVQLAIRALLTKGTPVRVGVLDSPIGMIVHDHKLVAYESGGHTVLIVGCDKTSSQFMYVDPWGGPGRIYAGKSVQFTGSKMKYEGGIAGAMPTDECLYMGMLAIEFDATRKVAADSVFSALAEAAGSPNIIRQTRATENGFNTASGTFLEIVAGPPI